MYKAHSFKSYLTIVKIAPRIVGTLACAKGRMYVYANKRWRLIKPVKPSIDKITGKIVYV